MPLVLKTFFRAKTGKDEKSLLLPTYPYAPIPLDTHTPLRYACGSSGSHAPPPPAELPIPPPPPPPQLPPPPPGNF